MVGATMATPLFLNYYASIQAHVAGRTDPMCQAIGWINTCTLHDAPHAELLSGEA